MTLFSLDKVRNWVDGVFEVTNANRFWKVPLGVWLAGCFVVSLFLLLGAVGLPLHVIAYAVNDVVWYYGLASVYLASSIHFLLVWIIVQSWFTVYDPFAWKETKDSNNDKVKLLAKLNKVSSALQLKRVYLTLLVILIVCTFFLLTSAMMGRGGIHNLPIFLTSCVCLAVIPIQIIGVISLNKVHKWELGRIHDLLAN